MILVYETFTGRGVLVYSASVMWGGSKESSSRSSTGTSQSPRTTSCPITIIYTRRLLTCSSILHPLPLRPPTIIALSIWQKTRYPHGVIATNPVLLTLHCPPSPLTWISPSTSLTRGERYHRAQPLQGPVVLLWISASRALWISSIPSLSLTSGVRR